MWLRSVGEESRTANVSSKFTEKKTVRPKVMSQRGHKSLQSSRQVLALPSENPFSSHVNSTPKWSALSHVTAQLTRLSSFALWLAVFNSLFYSGQFRNVKVINKDAQRAGSRPFLRLDWKNTWFATLSLGDQNALHVASWWEIKPTGLAAALCNPVFNVHWWACCSTSLRAGADATC